MDGKVYKQQAGGPIGLEITGVLARIVMLWWDRAFLDKLEKVGINMIMYSRYVDDGNMALNATEVGARIVQGKVSIQPESIEEDTGIPADKRTAKLISSVANTISPMIQMEEECPSNHPDGRMPILDLEVWVEKRKIHHQFFKKPMAGRKVVQARSAFSTSKKRSILLEEGMRRVRNCSPELPWSKKVYFLNKFSSDLKYSGHTISFRKTLLKRIVARYDVELANHLEEKTRLYRNREERINMKEANKMNSMKDTWFRVGGYTSTLMVPATPNGVLAEKVRENLEKGRQPAKTKTKVIEDGGSSVRKGIIQSNQFPRQKCERENCLLCLQQEGENKSVICDKENIGYAGECSRCPAGSFAYIGETSKTAFTRMTQHLTAYRAASTANIPAPPQLVYSDLTKWPRAAKSWMWEHTRDCHGGIVGQDGGVTDYKMKVDGRFLKCLYRQVDEDVRMQQFEKNGGVLLNSKYEYFMPKSVQPVFRQQ